MNYECDSDDLYKVRESHFKSLDKIMRPFLPVTPFQKISSADYKRKLSVPASKVLHEMLNSYLSPADWSA